MLPSEVARMQMNIPSAACIFFTPFFTAVYNQERLILETIYVLKVSKSLKQILKFSFEPKNERKYFVFLQ